MNCNSIQELFGIYFDLPADDPRRRLVDSHISSCDSCREDFQLWKESADLIRLAQEETEPYLHTALPVTDKVMKRIYQSEDWRTPISDRIYSIPYRLRRNVTAIIACCLALFLVSFVYTLTTDNRTALEDSSQYGFKQAAKASIKPADSLNVHTMARATLASAGPAIIEPVKIGPIRTVPDYLLAMSVLGLISTLLIMNWLSRTRA